MAGTVSSDLADGPVLSLINKRLRALRKKLNRITQMEDSVAQGKALNKEQEETLRSKPYVVAAIDELDKLRHPLSAAVAEEITAALEKPAPTDCEAPVEKEEEAPAEKEGESFKVVEDLLNLLYFGSMFDVKSQNDYTATMLTRTHERGCCLTYDYVTDDDNAVLLGERDLDLISSLGGLLVSRPANSSLSHKSALQSCIEHAKLWLSQSDQHIGQAPDVTYAQLREKLNKIMASDYFTAMPEMRFPAEVASATGSYASFQAPAQGSVLTADTVPDSGVAAQNEQREELVAHAEEAESYDYQSGHVEQFQQAEEAEQFSEFPSQEDENREDPREFELREQQQAPRRSYRGGSRGMGGGGRRGYPNGRGGRGSSRGGGFQNGRGQYYDQPGGSYYPRNNFRGRGGRGGSYGGVNNYPAATEAGTAES